MALTATDHLHLNAAAGGHGRNIRRQGAIA